MLLTYFLYGLQATTNFSPVSFSSGSPIILWSHIISFSSPTASVQSAVENNIHMYVINISQLMLYVVLLETIYHNSCKKEGPENIRLKYKEAITLYHVTQKKYSHTHTHTHTCITLTASLQYTAWFIPFKTPATH